MLNIVDIFVALKSWYFLGYDEIGRYFGVCRICWYFFFWGGGGGFEVRVVAQPL